jgi:transposase
MGRRRFTAEFKREAVKLASAPGAVKSKVASDLGLHANVLRKWVLEFETSRREAKPGAPLKSEQQAEIERLRKEVAKLKTERDILKKAAVSSTGQGNILSMLALRVGNGANGTAWSVDSSEEGIVAAMEGRSIAFRNRIGA